MASLVGAHKSPEALEASILAKFLMDHFWYEEGNMNITSLYLM